MALLEKTDPFSVDLFGLPQPDNTHQGKKTDTSKTVRGRRRMMEGVVADDDDAQSTSEKNNEKVEITAQVVREVFYKEKDHFMILSVILDGDNEWKESTVLTNSLSRYNKGDVIKISGQWEQRKNSEKKQIKADVVELQLSKDLESLIKWMRNNANLIGVGDGTISRLVDYFGENLANVLDDQDKLIQAGISEARAETIATVYSCDVSGAKTMASLFKLGLLPSQVRNIFMAYGSSAIDVITENPWEALLGMNWRISFDTVDDIARRLDVDMRGRSRIVAGLRWIVSDMITAGGHCGINKNDLIHLAEKKLKLNKYIIDVAFDEFLEGHNIVEDPQTGLISPRILWEAERDVAQRLMTVADYEGDGRLFASEASDFISQAEVIAGRTLDDDGQRVAAMMALQNRACIITGGPGTGKSTTQEIIVKSFELMKKRITLCCPTGKAARRLAEATGREALTIHSTLGVDLDFNFIHNQSNPLNTDVVIVDETSMVDIALMQALLNATPDHAHLIFVGDSDQLPSVGPGQVLRDMIDSNKIPVTRLTKIHRLAEAEGGGIATAVAMIREGVSPLGEKLNGFDFIEENKDIPGVVSNLIFETLKNRDFDPIRDVQVLAPIKRGDAGVYNLNTLIKERYNPLDADTPSFDCINGRVSMGDKVMQTANRMMRTVANQYQRVCNGEIGYIKETTERAAVIDIGSADIAYQLPDFINILPAYASTVHKAQGCECPVIILVLAPTNYNKIITRNLLITGISRGKKECYVVGDRAVFEAAIANDVDMHRCTSLIERINEYPIRKQDDNPESELSDTIALPLTYSL